MKRRELLALGAGLGAAGLLPAAWAQGGANDYPSRPIRMVVPYAAGGGLDTITRVVARALSEQLGQSIIVDNRAGAGGVIGADTVARAPADGYTLLMAGNPELVIAQAVTPATVHYDVLKDFVPITLVAESTNIIFAHPSVTGSLADILAGRTRVDGGLSVGTPGQGSPQQIILEVLNAASKQKLVHVPYKGAAPAVADVMSGQVKLGIVGAPPVLAPMRAGRLRGLAVTGRQRTSLAPDLPTVEEATGIQGVDGFTTWYGLLAPAGTPAGVVARLEKVAAAVLAAPELKKKLAAVGTDLVGLPAAAFAERIRSDVKRYQDVVRRFHIKPE